MRNRDNILASERSNKKNAIRHRNINYQIEEVGDGVITGRVSFVLCVNRSLIPNFIAEHIEKTLFKRFFETRRNVIVDYKYIDKGIHVTLALCRVRCNSDIDVYDAEVGKKIAHARCNKRMFGILRDFAQFVYKDLKGIKSVVFDDMFRNSDYAGNEQKYIDNVAESTEKRISGIDGLSKVLPECIKLVINNQNIGNETCLKSDFRDIVYDGMYRCTYRFRNGNYIAFEQPTEIQLYNTVMSYIDAYYINFKRTTNTNKQ